MYDIPNEYKQNIFDLVDRASCLFQCSIVYKLHSSQHRLPGRKIASVPSSDTHKVAISASCEFMGLFEINVPPCL